MRKLADLYLIGIGIRGMEQISVEALAALKRCRKIFHTTDQQRALARINRNVVDLDAVFWTDDKHQVVYDRVVDLVLDEVEKGPGVASVIYGHPLFFDDIHAELIRHAKKLGLEHVVLPGISSLDTLCIDLNIDYGEGLQVFEAEELVERPFTVNPNLHTLIFQIGEFGMNTLTSTPPFVRGRFKPIQDYLMRFFPADHRIVIAFSDDGDGSGSSLLKTRLRALDSHRRRISLGTTMYVPPIS